MKTRCVFTPDDFQCSGQMIIHDSSPRGSTDLSFAITVSYKIGYIPAMRGSQGVTKISLSDGMIILYPTMEALCESLNTDPEGYRPMSKLEIERILGAQGSRFAE